MRTTLDIDMDLLKEAEDILNEPSASKAVNLALREVIRRRKLQELRDLMGKIDLIDNWRELEELEMEETREQLG